MAKVSNAMSLDISCVHTLNLRKCVYVYYLGRFQMSMGDVYEGDFVDGKEHGYGVYIYSNGARYEGQFKEGMMHGLGEHCGLLGFPVLLNTDDLIRMYIYSCRQAIPQAG